MFFFKPALGRQKGTWLVKKQGTANGELISHWCLLLVHGDPGGMRGRCKRLRVLQTLAFGSNTLTHPALKAGGRRIPDASRRATAAPRIGTLRFDALRLRCATQSSVCLFGGLCGLSNGVLEGHVGSPRGPWRPSYDTSKIRKIVVLLAPELRW